MCHQMVLIDGQQRMTTIMVLLAAIRDIGIEVSEALDNANNNVDLRKKFQGSVLKVGTHILWSS